MNKSAEIPVCSSLGMVGRAEELIDRPDSDSSRPEGTAGAAGGVTAESWTCRKQRREHEGRGEKDAAFKKVTVIQKRH